MLTELFQHLVLKHIQAPIKLALLQTAPVSTSDLVGAQVQLLIHAALLMATARQALVGHRGLLLACQSPSCVGKKSGRSNGAGALMNVDHYIFVVVRKEYCIDHTTKDRCKFNNYVKTTYVFRTFSWPDEQL